MAALVSGQKKLGVWLCGTSLSYSVLSAKVCRCCMTRVSAPCAFFTSFFFDSRTLLISFMSSFWLCAAQYCFLARFDSDVSKRDRLVERRHRNLHAARELLLQAWHVCDAPWRVWLELLGAGALGGAPNWMYAEGDDELIVVERGVLGVGDLQVVEAGEPRDVVLVVGEGVAEREKVRADDDLRGKVGEGQCAVENVVAQALVGVVIAQRAEEGTRVQVRVSMGASKSSGMK